MKLAILHGISCADTFFKRRIFRRCDKFFVTSPSVQVYLKEKYLIDSELISSYLTVDEVRENKQSQVVNISNILHHLDNKNKELIEKTFGKSFSFFFSAFSYDGHYHYHTAYNFDLAMQKLIEELKPSEIFLSHKASRSDLFCVKTFCLLFKERYPDIKWALLPNDFAVLDGLAKARRSEKVLNYLTSFSALKGLIKRRLNRGRGPNSNPAGERVLLNYPLYELKEVIEELGQYELIKFQNHSGNEKVNPDFKYSLEEENFAGRYLLNIIEERINNNFENWFQTFSFYKKMHSEKPFKAVLTGVSPIFNPFGFIAEYFRSIDVPLLDFQHGSLFGEVEEYWHFECDYNRSDYFFTFGLDQKHIERNYPKHQAKCEFVPVGKLIEFKTQSGAQEIDILFPITNTMGLIDGGFQRVNPEILHQRQYEILKYLNDLKGIKVYVKPIQNVSEDDLSVKRLFKEFPNLKVVDNLNLNEFYQRYHPRLTLIEFPSSPVTDALPIDTDIIVLSDPVNPYIKEVETLLSQRVHICHDLEAVKARLKEFIDGRLTKLRDEKYMAKYLYKKDGHKKFLIIVDKIIKKEELNIKSILN